MATLTVVRTITMLRSLDRKLCGRGLSVKSAAADLEVDIKTIRRHLADLRKLGQKLSSHKDDDGRHRWRYDRGCAPLFNQKKRAAR